MWRDQAKRKGKATKNGSGDIGHLTTKMDNLKLTLEQFLVVAQEKEKNRVMTILTRNTSKLIGREKEMMLKAKVKIAKKYNI